MRWQASYLTGGQKYSVLYQVVANICVRGTGKLQSPIHLCWLGLLLGQVEARGLVVIGGLQEGLELTHLTPIMYIMWAACI